MSWFKYSIFKKLGGEKWAILKCSVSCADLISAAAASKEKTGILCNFILLYVKPQLQIYFFLKNQVQSDRPEQQHFIATLSARVPLKGCWWPRKFARSKWL